MPAIAVDTETRRLFEMIDAMDAEGFAATFAADGSFRFGNADPVAGREAVRDAVAGFFSTIGSLRHRVTGVWTGAWEHGAVRSVEVEVVYTRKDGSVTPAIPATSTLRMRGDLIQDYRIFVDLTPLFASA